jgi:hypothetical protein
MDTTRIRNKLLTASLAGALAAATLAALAVTGAGTASADCSKDASGQSYCTYDQLPAGRTDCSKIDINNPPGMDISVPGLPAPAEKPPMLVYVCPEVSGPPPVKAPPTVKAVAGPTSVTVTVTEKAIEAGDCTYTATPNNPVLGVDQFQFRLDATSTQTFERPPGGTLFPPKAHWDIVVDCGGGKIGRTSVDF